MSELIPATRIHNHCGILFERDHIADENGIKGNASVGKTTYADGSAEYTLIISFEGRAFYFKAPVE